MHFSCESNCRAKSQSVRKSGRPAVRGQRSYRFWKPVLPLDLRAVPVVPIGQIDRGATMRSRRCRRRCKTAKGRDENLQSTLVKRLHA